MSQDHQPRACLAERLQPRHNTPDTGIIADLAVGKRHIQVKPNETAFASCFNFIDKQKGRIHE